MSDDPGGLFRRGQTAEVAYCTKATKRPVLTFKFLANFYFFCCTESHRGIGFQKKTIPRQRK
jgi:hypothetical protein